MAGCWHARIVLAMLFLAVERQESIPQQPVIWCCDESGIKGRYTVA
jgi:hypothetical protein